MQAATAACWPRSTRPARGRARRTVRRDVRPPPIVGRRAARARRARRRAGGAGAAARASWARPFADELAKEWRPLAEVRYRAGDQALPGNGRARGRRARPGRSTTASSWCSSGPSGSGKTTALRMLAGLEEVDAGAVCIGDRDVTDVPPKDRDVAMVFQNYALYPYLDRGRQHRASRCRSRKVKKAERERRVHGGRRAARPHASTSSASPASSRAASASASRWAARSCASRASS